MKRCMIVDDSSVIRKVAKRILTGPDMMVVEASTGAQALDMCLAQMPDIIVVDGGLTDMTTVEFIRQAVELGAAGYVLKGITRRELVATVGAVCEGESVLAREALRRLLGGVARVNATRDGGPRATPLTDVERDVLAMLADGRTNKEIAQHLRWSVGSVKKCVQRLLKVLEVSDRTQAAVEAVRRKLVD